MGNYDSNYAIAQEISARLGNEPIPFDSVYSICLQIYQELGGTEQDFDSVYSILLEILPLVDGGISSKVIDDNSISTTKTWSSSKLNTQLGNKQDVLTAGEGIQISGSTISVVGKQDTISDLQTIREGAALGATALQSVPAEYVTDSELSTELADYATTSDLNTGLSGKQNTLTAGTNILISGNTISAVDTIYTAGTNIEISGTTISATYQTASTAEIEALFA